MSSATRRELHLQVLTHKEMMKSITEKQKQLIIQLLIKNKRKQEIKGINVLSKKEADEYIKELLTNK